jgi:hypothetical protein
MESKVLGEGIPEHSDETSDNDPRQRQTQRETIRHRDSSDLR